MAQAELYWIWRETMNKLSSFSRRVSEGRDVMAASEFARWLQFSGIIGLLEANSNSESGPLKVDGPLLRWTTDELVKQCNERFVSNCNDPNFKVTEFQTMHEKIDTIAGYLARLSVAPAVVVSPLPCEAVETAVISPALNGHKKPDKDGNMVPSSAGGVFRPGLNGHKKIRGYSPQKNRRIRECAVN